MCDVFVFIFIHSVVQLVDDYMYRLMVSFFVYADVGPCPPPRYQRWVVVIAEVMVLVRNPHRQRREAETILPHLERFSKGIYVIG